ncbi:JHE-like toxin PirA [Xenorhabdus anantnagensis]|uniref:JHE-like toxin PirA n=1 Tax=Xenorhabdus anantnagensis TaxID=3025875 RepID=A0ABT5LVB2_9GAMM|nr:JHE-like toxin PirA [Xenorhabdus anantnagensis]MDC9598359.1 JHE-like toxin PirA [Xenorhabdus anantnagensis]
MITININTNESTDTKNNESTSTKIHYNSGTPASENYTVNIYKDMTIEPRSSIEAIRIDTPIIPETRPNYYVANSGPASSVRAVFYWSHSFTSQWFEYSSITVKAGEDGILQSPSNSVYYSKVVIYNDTDKRAFVTGYNK